MIRPEVCRPLEINWLLRKYRETDKAQQARPLNLCLKLNFVDDGNMAFDMVPALAVEKSV